jgi:heat shock transcription factor
MSMINASNASVSNAGSATITTKGQQALDFPAALNHSQTANGGSPLTSKERSDMLQLMARDTQLASPPAASTPKSTISALTSATPAPSSFIDYAHLNNNSEELERLSKMQAEQNANVETLRSLIQPLSPTGSIPGLTEPGNGQWLPDGLDPGAPGALDLDQIFNSGDYFGGTNVVTTGEGDGEDLVDFDAGANAHDLKLAFDGLGDDGTTLPGGEMTDEGDAGTIKTMSNSEGPSPAAFPDVRDEPDGSPSSKRRKRG